MPQPTQDHGRRAVRCTGGWMHPPEASTPELAALLEGLGFDLNIVTDPSLLAEALIQPDGSSPDLFVINACWFSMNADRYTPEQRAGFGVGADRLREEAIEKYILGGGPTLAIHAAVTCFDSWPRWGDLIGGAWEWGRSWHNEPEDIQWQAVRDNIDITWVDVVEPFVVTDELYQDCSLRPGTRVLARADSGQPLLWAPVSSDRVAVSLLGHDERSLSSGGHRALLVAAVRHLTRPES